MYRQPDDLAEALEALASADCAVLAGGTDFYPAHVGRAVSKPVLDISRVAGLRGIEQDAHGWRIGALSTWTDVVAAELPQAYRALVQAALEVGGRQIQNRGTIGGNLCNASPAADGVPALLALDARVELASRRGRREMPLTDFITGNRRTELAADELLTAIVLPPRGPSAQSRFLKLGHRRYLVISIVMVAAMIETDADGRVVAVGIAVGACSAAARRLPALEARLVGLDRRRVGVATRALLAAERSLMLAPLAPIDDVRGTAGYRLDAATTLLQRALGEIAA